MEGWKAGVFWLSLADTLKSAWGVKLSGVSSAEVRVDAPVKIGTWVVGWVVTNEKIVPLELVPPAEVVP